MLPVNVDGDRPLELHEQIAGQLRRAIGRARRGAIAAAAATGGGGDRDSTEAGAAS